MLELFRTNQIAGNIFLLLYIFALRFSVFIQPSTWEPKAYSVLSGAIYNWIGFSGLIPDITAMFLVFIQAILLNQLVSNFRMSNETTLFPGLFYVLLASAIPEFLHLSPALLANTFYILALMELFNTYKKYSCSDTIFNTGFFIALASLFYFSYSIYFVLIFIGLGILRAFNIKERLQLLVGFIVPYILSGVVYFWNGDLTYYFEQHFTNNFGFVGWIGKLGLAAYAELAFFSILIIIVLLNYGRFNLKKNIQVQKYISILYWALLFGGLSLIIQSNIQFDHLFLIAAPLAVFLAFIFVLIKKRQVAEVLHLVLVLFVLLFQFKDFWVDKLVI